MQQPCIIFVLTLNCLLSACSSHTVSNNPSSISGRVSNYSGSPAKLIANDGEGFSPNRTVGLGQLQTDGTFDLQLDEVISQDILGSPTSNPCEGVQISVPEILLYPNVGILVEQNDELTGFIIQTSVKSLAAGSDLPIGERAVTYWYTDKDVTIKGSCQPEGTEEKRTYDLSLEKGWNIAIIARISETERSFTTSSSRGLMWIFVPFSPENITDSSQILLPRNTH